MSKSYKPIKFFLDICGKKIRDLDELRAGADFHLDRLYELFTKGILERWLQVHGYNDEYDALAKLPKESLNEDNARAFCKIIRPDDAASSLEAIIQNFKLSEKWKKELEAISTKGKTQLEVINNYHAGFDNLLQSIKNDTDNMPAVKTHLSELSLKYLNLFNINPHACIRFFKEEAPVAVLLMLANPVLREQLQQIDEFDNIKKFLNEAIDILGDSPLSKFVFHEQEKNKNIISIIRFIKKDTQGMWEDVEPNDKEFMILYADESTTVRPYRGNNEELKKEDLLSFKIIKGIDYRSNNDNYYLVYMEI